MKILLYIILINILEHNIFATENELTVDPKSKYCITEGGLLYCDFKDLDGTAYFRSGTDLVDETIGLIFISNVEKLDIDYPTCKNMSLFNIDTVKFSDRSVICPGKGPNIRVVDCYVNQIPHFYTSISIWRSRVAMINHWAPLNGLEISKSKINQLSINSPLQNKYDMVIEHSEIGKLLKLEVTDQVFLKIENTSIGTIEKESFIIQNAEVTIRNCDIQTVKDAVVIGNNAKFSMKDITGTFNIISNAIGSYASSSKDSKHMKRPPGVPDVPKRQPPLYLPNSNEKVPTINDLKDLEKKYDELQMNCSELSSLIWIVPTTIALIELVVIVCVVFKPSIRGRKRNYSLEESSSQFSVYVDDKRSGSENYDIRRRPNY